MLINKISVPSTITLEKPRLFKPSVIELPIAVRDSTIDFPDSEDFFLKILPGHVEGSFDTPGKTFSSTNEKFPLKK